MIGKTNESWEKKEKCDTKKLNYSQENERTREKKIATNGWN